jgi:hypothetical protein
MRSFVEDRRVTALDRAVDRLTARAAACAVGDPERVQLEAARDRLARYALGVHDLAAAGASAARLDDLMDRGWRDAALAFKAAVRPERAP